MNFAQAVLIMKKEWRESFNSPTPYVVMVLFYLITGWFFIYSLFLLGQATMEEFFSPLPLLLAIFLPAFAMRVFAEEYKSGTIEGLSTLPLRDTEIVLGKYLAVVGVWALMLGVSFIHLILLFAMGRPDAGQALSGFLGALLLGGFYAACGVFASSLTRSQVVGGLLGFFFCFAFFLFGKLTVYMPGNLGAFLGFLGVDAHYESFLRGVIDSRDVLYFLSGIALFLAGTLASFNSRRWR